MYTIGIKLPPTYAYTEFLSSHYKYNK